MDVSATVGKMSKTLAREHYRRIMMETDLLLQYCQVFGYANLIDALIDVIKKYISLEEEEGKK
jgi:hypothetical protein